MNETKTIEEKDVTKPSSLLRFALQCLRKCEADPRYKVNMSFWWVIQDAELLSPWPDREKVCKVCLAGSLIAQCLIPKSPELRRMHAILPHYVKDKTVGVFVASDAMLALEYIRQGKVRQGLFCLGIKRDWPEELFVAPYWSEAFYADLEDIAADLEEENL